MDDIPFCFFRHGLPLDQGDDAVHDDAAHSIKDTDEDTDDQYARQNDERVIDHLALCRPHDLLQLALHFAEPAAEAFAGTDKEVFLFCFCHDVHPFYSVKITASLRLGMDSVLLAESAILLHFQTIGVILFVLHGVVVSLLAFVASERDLHSHCRHLLNFCLPA